MMSEIKNIFDISGRAMAAQMVRLNTVASNLANAGTISGTKEEAFRALKPVFQTLLNILALSIEIFFPIDQLG